MFECCVDKVVSSVLATLMHAHPLVTAWAWALRSMLCPCIINFGTVVLAPMSFKISDRDMLHVSGGSRTVADQPIRSSKSVGCRDPPYSDTSVSMDRVPA